MESTLCISSHSVHSSCGRDGLNCGCSERLDVCRRSNLWSACSHSSEQTRCVSEFEKATLSSEIDDYSGMSLEPRFSNLFAVADERFVD